MNVMSILLVLVFLVIVGLMVFDKLNALVAIPLMGVALSLVAGVPLLKITNDVIGGGFAVLASATFTTFIASIFGEMVRRTGIAEKIIRTAAELGGDNNYLVAIFCFLAVGFSFIGLTGAGTRIMMGLIIFPIMLSVGVPKTVTIFVLLSGNFLGYFMNLARWKFIQSLVNTDFDFIRNVALMLLPLGIIISIAMIILGIKFKGKVYSWAAKAEEEGTEEKPKLPWYAMISPIIPLVLIVVASYAFNTEIDVNACFVIAMVYVVLVTGWRNKWKGSQELLSRSVFDGFGNASMTIGLYFGIGMVLNAAKQPQLLDPITAMLKVIVPGTPFGVILIFGIIGPFLCLYRGPLNPWGLGGAVAGILATTNLPLGVLVAMFWLYDYFAGVNDPTSSQVVWSAGYLEYPVRSYALGVLPYDVVFVFLGIIIAVLRFMVFA